MKDFINEISKDSKKDAVFITFLGAIFGAVLTNNKKYSVLGAILGAIGMFSTFGVGYCSGILDEMDSKNGA